VEREVLKLAVQRPVLAGPVFDALPAEVFTHPAYGAVRELIGTAGGAAAGGDDAWVSRLREQAPDDPVRALVTELAVEPLRSTGEADERYAGALLARVQELATTRRIAELKSRLQRLNPLEHPEECNRLFGELVALEQHRRGLREQAIGAL
jgi:DNA primase